MDGIFSPWHIVVVLLVGAVLFYRGDKLPDMARSVGRSLRVFKTEIKGLAEDDKAREAAQNDSDGDTDLPVSTTKAIAAPAEQVAPRIVAEASAPIPVHAEIVRPQSEQVSRPRPRPAGSTSRQ